MVLDVGNARIFGSDDDKVWVGPLGVLMPTGLAVPAAPLVDVGWLNDDGIGFSPSDSLQKFRGHQGGRVVRTKITESDTTFSFQCLETKALTLGLQNNILEHTTAVGVTTMRNSSGRRVLPRGFVIDVFDHDDELIHYRHIIPRGEIGERSSWTLSRSDITGYTFQVEVIDHYFTITNDPAAVAA